MNTNASIMSYNPAHHTSFYHPSLTPGVLIPENLRDLALNRLVFPDLHFDPSVDIPAEYTISPDIVCLGIFDIPNQTSYRLSVTTTSGETYGSRVGNIVQHQIKPSIAGMGITFDPDNMWQSGTVTWAEAEVHFPFSVTLDKVGVHSQHSGQYHEADSVRIQTYNGGAYSLVSLADLTHVDQYVTFGSASDSLWKFSFRTGPSGSVVIRGLEFFLEDEPVFPQLVPYTLNNPDVSRLPSRPVLTTPADGFVTTEPVIDLDWTGEQALSYRLQVDTSKDFCTPLVNSVMYGAGYDYTVPSSNQNYYWRVMGRNDSGHGFGQWSKVREFSAGTIQMVSEAPATDDLALYFNPASGRFTVESGSSSESVLLQVVSPLGGIVYAEQLAGTGAHDIRPGLAAGVYFLIVRDGAKLRSRKLIVE